MIKYFYFRDVANEDADDDIQASFAIPVSSVTGLHATSITNLRLFFKKQGLVVEGMVDITVTRGKLQEVMHEFVAALNGYSHSKAPLTVMGDATTTTHGTSSVEGNDKTKGEIFFSNDVTAVSIGVTS